MQAVCTPPETVTDRTERVSRLTPLVARHTVAPAEVDVTQAKQMALLYSCVLYCFGRSSLQSCHCSLFNDRCICLSLWQVHASISRITATRSEMPKGRDGTWTWMYNDVHGYGRIQQIFRYCQLLILMCSIPDILEASQYLSPSHRLRSDRETAVGTA